MSFVVSTEGGVNIEDVAHNTPEKIVTFSVDPATGIMGHHGRTVAKALGLSGDLAKQAEKLVTQLYAAFVAKDMAMLEINPLVVTKQGELRVLDAKVSFDDNALYRHPEVAGAARRDRGRRQGNRGVEIRSQLCRRSTATSAAWSTAPASRWRPWTSSSSTAWRRRTSSTSAAAPTKAKVAAAFKIITADPNVKGILVNIFGGIMKCDIIAEGVVAAVKEVGLKVPLVVRLEGTNVDAGKKIIRESGLNVLPADDLDDAAQKIVKAVKGS